MVAKLSRLSPARLRRTLNKLQHFEEKLPALLRVQVLKGFFMLLCLGPSSHNPFASRPLRRALLTPQD